MKILLIHHRIPYPLNSGMDKVRYNLIRSLSLEHQVTLIAPVDEYTEQGAIEHMRKQCHELIAVPIKNRINSIQKSRLLHFYRLLRLILFRVPMYIVNNEYPAVARQVQQLCETRQFDLVQVTSNITSGYLRFARLLRPHVLGPMDDSIEAARTNMTVAKTFRARFFFRMEYYARKHYDIKACLNSDWVFLHSKEDLKRINELAGGLPRARILPVAIEPEDEPRPALLTPLEVQEQNSMVIVGGLGSNFNVDAVLFFHQEIFPLILKQVPDAKLYVVGQTPPPAIKSLEKGGQVIVTGCVPDVRPYIERAAVYVAPIRAGTGIKTKMVEALSLGKAIVATRLAQQGLWDIGENVICIKDNPIDLANEIVNLLQDDDLRVKLGVNARSLYERSYTFNAVAPRTLEVYNEIKKTLNFGKK